MLIKAIKASTGHPGEINGSRTQPAYGHPPPDKSFKYLQGTIWLIQVGIREPCDHAGIYYILLFTYADRFIVKGSTLSPFCYKKLIDKGVVDSAKHHLFLVFNSNGNAANRDTMGKVHCAVNW